MEYGKQAAKKRVSVVRVKAVREKSIFYVGTINQCLVGVREVFKNAILCNAAAILLFHNHPSGDCELSQDDMQISHRLRKCGELLGIPILDHIILGHNSFKSLAETLEWTTWREHEKEIIKV